MERKHGFLAECIYCAVLIGWILWCLNMQVKLMQIDFGDVTAENTAAVVEYDCISMKGSFFFFPIYEMELDGKTYRHKSFSFERTESFERTAVRYNPSNPSEFYSVEEIEIRDWLLHFQWLFTIVPGLIAAFESKFSMEIILSKHTEFRYHYE